MATGAYRVDHPGRTDLLLLLLLSYLLADYGTDSFFISLKLADITV